MESVLLKNAGLASLLEIANVLEGVSKSPITGYDFTPEEISLFVFAPVVSCDVERSFSQYKAVLRDNRKRLTFDHLSKYLFLYCNK